MPNNGAVQYITLVRNPSIGVSATIARMRDRNTDIWGLTNYYYYADELKGSATAKPEPITCKTEGSTSECVASTACTDALDQAKKNAADTKDFNENTPQSTCEAAKGTLVAVTSSDSPSNDEEKAKAKCNGGVIPATATK